MSKFETAVSIVLFLLEITVIGAIWGLIYLVYNYFHSIH